MKEEKKPEYLEKTPNEKLQKMQHNKALKFKPHPRLKPTPHNKAQKFKPHPRLKPTVYHRGQALATKADMLTITGQLMEIQEVNDPSPEGNHLYGRENILLLVPTCMRGRPPLTGTHLYREKRSLH